MMTKEEILNAAKKWEDFCIALRRDFHESLNCPAGNSNNCSYLY